MPDNDQMYLMIQSTPAEQIELKTPDSGQTPDPGPRLPPRWPLLVHPVSGRTGVGAPSARRSKYGVLLYVFRMKTPRRFLETPPLELAEFLHVAMNRDSKK